MAAVERQLAQARRDLELAKTSAMAKVRPGRTAWRKCKRCGTNSLDVSLRCCHHAPNASTPRVSLRRRALGSSRTDTPSSSPGRPQRDPTHQELLAQADAAVRGAADVLTFGKADDFAAFAGFQRRKQPVRPLKRSFDPKGEVPCPSNGATTLIWRSSNGGISSMRPIGRRPGSPDKVGNDSRYGCGKRSRPQRRRRQTSPNGTKLLRNVQSLKRLGLDMRGVTQLAATGGAGASVAEQASFEQV